MMTLVYAVMWLLIAIFLFSMGIRENKIYMLFSTYFVFNAVWWCVSYFVDTDMFHGTMGWVFRGITAVFLIIGCVYYYLYKQKEEQKKHN